jgi:N-methylhydantoinase B/oxoprolinase/acetone carboxylase alpha subunit
LNGGGDALPGRNWIERTDGSVEELTATGWADVGAGDRFVIETPGGGGYGPHSRHSRGSGNPPFLELPENQDRSRIKSGMTK